MSLVLLSGGMDSVVALYHALEWDREVDALSFHYGQRHARELDAAVRIAEHAKQYGLRSHNIKVISPQLFSCKSSILGTSTPVSKYDTPPAHEVAEKDPSFIPHRNLLFFVIAAGYARSMGIQKIVTGIRGGFPDCTMNFEMLVEDVLRNSDPEWPLRITSPCHGSRADTIGLAYELPGCWQALAYSLTCFEGTEPPCGKCLPCLKRAEGFEQYGKPDPLLVRLAAEKLSPALPN